MVAKMKEKPWPVYKGKSGVENDIRNGKSIAKETDAVIKVDTNAGWTLEQALQKYHY